MLKKSLITIIVIMMIPLSVLGDQHIKNFNIAVILDSKNIENRNLLKLILKETNDLIDNKNLKINFNRKNIFYSNKKEEINKKYDEFTKNENIDLIISLGFISSTVISQKKEYLKPTIISSIVSSNIQKIENKKNMTYIDFSYNIYNDLELFFKIYHYKKINILLDDNYLSLNPQIKIFFKEINKSPDYQFEIIGISEFMKGVSKPKDKLAVYLTDINNLNKAKLDELTNYLKDNKIPFFTGFNKNNDSIAFFKRNRNDIKIARRIALDIKEIIIDNKKISNLDKKLNLKKELMVNLKAVNFFNIKLDYNILIDYESINNENNLEIISFYDAIKESVEKNLNILVKIEESKISKKEINKAWNNYLPNLTASLTGAIIDENRAKASFGIFPQKSVIGTITLQQLIFSEKANLNINVKKQVHKLNKYKIEEIKENIALDTAITYLNLMKIRTFKKIQRENLKLSKMHLEIAKSKQKANMGKLSDIYRWETQISLNKKKLIKVRANEKIAKMALMKLLHRSMETKFKIDENNLNIELVIKKYKKLDNYLKNSSDLKKFKDYFVKIGLKNAIELKEINQVDKIYKNQINSINKSYFLPTVAIQGKLSYKFWKDSPESEIKLPQGYEAFAPVIKENIPKLNDLEWQLGLNISLPIFDNYSRVSEKNITKSKISKLYLNKQLIMSELEQKIRTMIEEVATSYISINLSEDASNSVNKGLKLVESAYIKGIIPITELIDVQNNNLIAKELVLNSKYEFIINLMKAKRVAGFKLYHQNDENIINSFLNK